MSKKISDKMILGGKPVREEAQYTINNVTFTVYDENIDLDQRAKMVDELLNLLFEATDEGLVYHGELQNAIVHYIIVKYCTNISCKSVKTGEAVYTVLKKELPNKSLFSTVSDVVQTMVEPIIRFKYNLIIKQTTSISDTLVSAMGGILMRINNLLDKVDQLPSLNADDLDAVKTVLDKVATMADITPASVVSAVTQNQNQQHHTTATTPTLEVVKNETSV